MQRRRRGLHSATRYSNFTALCLFVIFTFLLSLREGSLVSCCSVSPQRCKGWKLLSRMDAWPTSFRTEPIGWSPVAFPRQCFLVGSQCCLSPRWYLKSCFQHKQLQAAVVKHHQQVDMSCCPLAQLTGRDVTGHANLREHK